METATDRAGVVLARGVCLGLIDRGFAPLTELTLPTGRRMDVCALGRDGTVWCVEVKSSRADFLSDAKWPAYLDWCDRFAFAVPEGFPEDLLPVGQGVLRADAHGFEEIRPAAEHRLPAARRKAMTLRFARLAAERWLLGEKRGCHAAPPVRATEVP